MMYCQFCQAQLEEHARFCSRCGAPVQEENGEFIYCVNCHAKLAPGALFCPECGYRIKDAQPHPEENEQGKREQLPLIRLHAVLYFAAMPAKHAFSFFKPDAFGELYIFQNRMELHSSKNPSVYPAVIIPMQDIRYVQETKLRAARAVKLVLKDGREPHLVLWDASRKGKAIMQETISLLRDILH